VIRIDPEFQSLIPPLRPEELAQLEANILAEGIRDPLVTWRGVLIDGHNRYAIAEKHGLPYQTVEREFDDRDAVADWIDRNQLGRRNLHPDQYALLVGRRYNRAKKVQGGTGANQYAKQTGNSYQSATAERIAADHGVSEKTVRNAGDFASAIDRVKAIAPTIEADVAMGTAPARKAVVKAAELLDRNPEAAAAILRGEKTLPDLLRDERRAKWQADVAAQVAVAPSGSPIIVRNDASTWLASLAPASVDLLLTDPPYSTDVIVGERGVERDPYLRAWLTDIAAFAQDWLPKALRTLKPTGRAFVCVGAYPIELAAYMAVAMPTQVLVWTYRNTIGPSPSHLYKQNWQAILYYAMPDAPPLDCPQMVEQFSVQDINAPDGRIGDRYHAWQKPITLGERFVRHATQPGATVIDPFAGTGTFLLAAAKLGRVGVGCERDPAMIAIAVQRGCVCNA